MKYLKTYENYIDNMQVGDYVLLNMKQIKNGLDSFSADENWYELPDENTVALIELISSDEDYRWYLYLLQNTKAVLDGRSSASRCPAPGVLRGFQKSEPFRL